MTLNCEDKKNEIKNDLLDCNDPDVQEENHIEEVYDMADKELTAQTVEQMIADAINTLVGKTAKQSIESDISDPGVDEAWKVNMKRTTDEYQDVSLHDIRQNRIHVDKVLSDAQKRDNELDKVSLQALQNAVETANMVGKQAVRHSDIAIDRQWNVDEQGYTVSTIISALKPTLESVVAKILADMAE